MSWKHARGIKYPADVNCALDHTAWLHVLHNFKNCNHSEIQGQALQTAFHTLKNYFKECARKQDKVNVNHTNNSEASKELSQIFHVLYQGKQKEVQKNASKEDLGMRMIRTGEQTQGNQKAERVLCSTAALLWQGPSVDLWFHGDEGLEIQDMYNRTVILAWVPFWFLTFIVL